MMMEDKYQSMAGTQKAQSISLDVCPADGYEKSYKAAKYCYQNTSKQYVRNTSRNNVHWVVVPEKASAYIIGKQHETIRFLERESGARIEVNRYWENNVLPETVFELTGTREEVRNASVLIDEFYAEWEGKCYSSNPLLVQVSNQELNNGITELENQSGAQIKIVQVGGIMKTVRLSGSVIQIDVAKQLIEREVGYKVGVVNQGNLLPPRLYPRHFQPPPPPPFNHFAQLPPNFPKLAPIPHIPQPPPPPFIALPPPPHSQANYGLPQGSNYAHCPPYPQTAQPQNYGHGCGDPKYDGQAPVQQPYGEQGYAAPQQGHAPQQQYNRPPAYGAPQAAPPQGQGYAPPVSAAQPYNHNVQPYQQYPYASGAITQPWSGAAPVTNDGYAQPQPAARYTQQVAHPAPAYGQQPSVGYGQYPQVAQPGYTDPAAAAATSAAAYGYQGPVDPSTYAASQGYSAAPPPDSQQGYAQAQTGYDWSAPQSGGYASAPAAPGAYSQYDASQQMFAAPR